MASTNNLALARHSFALENLQIDFLTHNESFYDWLSSYYDSTECNGVGRTDIAPKTCTNYSITLQALGSPHQLALPPSGDGLFTKFCLIADAHCYFQDGKFTSQAEGELAHQIEIDVSARTVRGNVG